MTAVVGPLFLVLLGLASGSEPYNWRDFLFVAGAAHTVMCISKYPTNKMLHHAVTVQRLSTSVHAGVHAGSTGS